MEETGRKSWVREHLWLLALLAGALVFVGWAGPMLSSKPIEAVWKVDFYELVKGSRENIWVGRILFGAGGTPVLATYWIFYGIVICGIVSALLAKRNPRFFELGLMLNVVAGILFLTSNIFYDYNRCFLTIKEASFIDYLEDWQSLASSRMAFGTVFATLFSFLAAILHLSGAYNAKRFALRDLLEIAIFSAAAIVLDLIQHFIPSFAVSGGSIGIATLPLLYVALRHGPLAGFVAGGLVFGLITCITDGYGVFLYPFDYLIGFGSVAILGFFKPLIFGENQRNYNLKGEIFIFVGCALAGLVRFIGSSLSSIVNYGLNLVGAMAYNVWYVFGSALISAVLLMALYGPLLRLQKSFPPNPSK